MVAFLLVWASDETSGECYSLVISKLLMYSQVVIVSVLLSVVCVSESSLWFHSVFSESCFFGSCHYHLDSTLKIKNNFWTLFLQLQRKSFSTMGAMQNYVMFCDVRSWRASGVMFQDALRSTVQTMIGRTLFSSWLTNISWIFFSKTIV